MGRLIEIAPAPGIVKDATTNAATGGYVDCDKVRFRKNFPEKIGGWVRDTVGAFVGKCRSMFTWATLDDSILTAVGTNQKYYVEESGLLFDITPIRRSVTLGADPFTTEAAASGVITVADTSHGAFVGDSVIFAGATAFDGLTTGDLNKEHIVTEIIDTNSYKVDTGGSATTGSVSGGGASVDADYLLNIGSASAVYGAGWGAGFWGRGAWGSAAEVTTLSSSLRLWSQTNWGEDLLFAPRYGEIYRYDSSVGSRGAAIASEGGASNVPVVVTEIMVATSQRIAIAFGVNEIGGSTHDELLIRWSDYEDYLNWTPSGSSAAGGFRLNIGSRIITALQARQEIVVWTDAALFGMPFVGEGDIFQLYLIDPNVSIIGPNAKVMLDGVVYWMGERGFRFYDGRVGTLPCPVEDFVFNGLNREHTDKVICGSNARFGEVWWIYPADGQMEPSRYAVFNVAEQIWYTGTLDRTFWIDRGINERPRAAGVDGYIYTHEFGTDDGSSNPLTAIYSFVETAPIEIGPNEQLGRGDRIAFVNRMIPDVTFRNSTGGSPTLTFTFRKRDYPGLAYADENTSIAKGATVDRYTKKKSIRLRSRAIAMRIENNEVGTDWRIGVQRFETRTDGRKR